jgi:hypothetical protein
MRAYIDQLRDLADAHGGLFTGTTGVMHQALRDLPGDRPTITRAALRDFLPSSGSYRPQSANYPGLKGGVDVFLIDTGSDEDTTATIATATYYPGPSQSRRAGI